MSILDRYLGRIILQYTLITLLVLLGLFAFVNFLEQLGDLGSGRYELSDAFLYLILTIPRIMYELFPLAALLGTIIGLSLLANDSELIVLRASGVSVWQITVSALKTGALFVIVAMLIGELVAPPADTRAQRGRAEALQRNHAPTGTGLWLRDAQNFINLGEVLPDLTLLGIKIFQFDDKKLRTLTSAADGKFDDGEWTLRDVKQTRIDNDGNIETARMETSRWRTGVTPQTLSVFLAQPDQLSMWQLRQHIHHLAQNRQQTAPYQLAFWNKIMLPLSTAIMVMLAIPFVFVNLRSGTLGRSLFVGILLGIGFYVANKSFGFFVLVYNLPPLLGATIPIIAFALLAMVMIRRVE